MPQKKINQAGKTSWVARWRDPAGNSRSKNFPTRREAKAHEDAQQRSVLRGDYVDPATLKITVAETMDRWAQRPIREGTRRSYLQTKDELGPLAHIPVRALTRADVDAWHAQLITGRGWHPAGDTGIAESTAREHVVRLSSAIKYAMESDIVARNVVKIPRTTGGIVAVRRSELPTADQISDVIELLEDGGAVYSMHVRRKNGWRKKVCTAGPKPVVADMVRVAVGLGPRISEECGLVVENVDFLRRTVRIEKQIDVNGKKRVPLKTGSSERSVPAADDALAILDRYCRGKEPGEFVFQTQNGTPYRAATVGGALRQAVQHLGYEFTFHSFRHYYASLLIDANVSVAGVQWALGHSSAATTLGTYTHLWPDTDEVARAAISGAVSGLDRRGGFLGDSAVSESG